MATLAPPGITLHQSSVYVMDDPGQNIHKYYAMCICEKQGTFYVVTNYGRGGAPDAYTGGAWDVSTSTQLGLARGRVDQTLAKKTAKGYVFGGFANLLTDEVWARIDQAAGIQGPTAPAPTWPAPATPVPAAPRAPRKPASPETALSRVTTLLQTASAALMPEHKELDALLALRDSIDRDYRGLQDAAQTYLDVINTKITDHFGGDR